MGVMFGSNMFRVTLQRNTGNTCFLTVTPIRRIRVMPDVLSAKPVVTPFFSSRRFFLMRLAWQLLNLARSSQYRAQRQQVRLKPNP